MRESAPPATGTDPRTPNRNFLVRYAARFDDGEIMRWAFRGLLLGAIGVLALDLRDLTKDDGWFGPERPVEPVVFEPLLPPAVADDGGRRETVDPRDDVTADDETLRQPIRFSLEPGGILAATGTIDPGSAARFADEIRQRGEYVSVVTLNSPGGSLDDAIAISNLIRENRITTEVADGALCASSCPLIFAGGSTRYAGPKAAIGLHQFYAATAGVVEPAQAMSDAQATTARISRHLSDLGIDPALWLHALETPPRQLYYLSKDELLSYRLTTQPPGTAKKISG